ncbi:PTS transporter subunit EIIC [Actinomadura flavalba]|uniref:PTS transporter subunit EIIC n=1 Tax=Actinomadura flavalba TaxID=1120938 RepID=UPI00036F3687|nr:PTS transporter subunit EIIC [Actinomadura flavalba]
MTTATGEATGPGPLRAAWARVFGVLQRIGRSLMLPIAILPLAGILFRLGQPDLLGADGLGWSRVAEVCGAAGGALLDNLPMLFAVGVAIGFARDSDGSTALAAVVSYLVFDRVTRTLFAHSKVLHDDVVRTVREDDGSLREIVDLGLRNPTQVLGGIVIGLIVALLFDRYHRIRLPSWLAFFGGRRFVPIAGAAAALALAVVVGVVWPLAGGWLDAFGNWLTGLGTIGAGLYGVANRLLLPFGLHHLLNSLVWFVFGTYDGPRGVVHGEIGRYLAGEPGAGAFLTGFFPVLMFGLPGAALAIWRSALPDNRAGVGGLMISAALTAFLTGVTEPIEFSFMFVAPVLYGVHVVLTGISLSLLAALDTRLGFTFSAGFFDMVLNATKSNTRGLPLVILVGIVYFVLYYVIFSVIIRRFNIATPGRMLLDD